MCEQQGGRLIRAFIIHFLESIISKLAISEISVAVETGLSHALSEILKTGIVRGPYNDTPEGPTSPDFTECHKIFIITWAAA